MNSVVFLDRDGTINHDPNGYIKTTEDFNLYPFAAEAIKIINSLQYKVIVVSNQSGIARGFFTVEDAEIINNFMKAELEKQNAILDLILYSPYFKGGVVEPYNIEHHSRKPNPGMFYEAMNQFSFKAKQSYMIGDKISDIEFGKSNGLITILVKTGEGEKTWNKRSELNVLPDFVVENLLSAAKLIMALKKNS